jgi:hypothetical protein
MHDFDPDIDINLMINDYNNIKQIRNPPAELSIYFAVKYMESPVFDRESHDIISQLSLVQKMLLPKYPGDTNLLLVPLYHSIPTITYPKCDDHEFDIDDKEFMTIEHEMSIQSVRHMTSKDDKMISKDILQHINRHRTINFFDYNAYDTLPILYSNKDIHTMCVADNLKNLIINRWILPTRYHAAKSIRCRDQCIKERSVEIQRWINKSKASIEFCKRDDVKERKKIGDINKRISNLHWYESILYRDNLYSAPTVSEIIDMDSCSTLIHKYHDCNGVYHTYKHKKNGIKFLICDNCRRITRITKSMEWYHAVIMTVNNYYDKTEISTIIFQNKLFKTIMISDIKIVLKKG